MSELPPEAMAHRRDTMRQRQATFRTTAIALALGATLAMALFVAMEVALEAFPGELVVPIVALFLLLDFLSLWLWRSNRREVAVYVLVIALVIVLFSLTILADGVTGPFVIVLAIVPLISGVLGGRTVAIATTLGISVIYALLALLEGVGVWEPLTRMPPFGSWVATVVVSLVTIAIGSAVAATFTQRIESAVTTLREQYAKLRESSREAEQLLEARRQAQEKQAEDLQQLMRAARRYVEFLDRVSTGDYEARLSVAPPESPDAVDRALYELGISINSTVETLAETVQDLQVVQRRYASEAWRSFARSQPHAGFRYQGDRVEPADDVWLTTMGQAIAQRQLVAHDGELAIPILLRDQVIGTIGVRRGGDGRWSDEELALIQAIVDQLAQTIESLRLLEETQRRATQERVVSQVTGRMRESLDVEDVIRSAAREMHQALGLPEVVVRLGGPTRDDETGI